MTLALSIRQPWASLILKAHKDIENRSWSTKIRGRVLVHASKGMTRNEHEDGIAFAVETIRTDPRNSGTTKRTTLRDLGFAFDDLPRGGIVGSVEIVDCVRESKSPWFMGEYGFVLRDPRVLPFQSCNGRLGFFDVAPVDQVSEAQKQNKETAP